uniref:DUF2790 domain-containing protein n=2 Tax=Pseudomonas syringae TaxID=317 RepID=A0A2P0QH74_PSESF|nr:hypothetical protein [Pseudomonas syringae pv. actinidiae]
MHLEICKMNTLASLSLALCFAFVTSFASADGRNDPVYGEMIRANEKSMEKYAQSKGKGQPEVIHYQYGFKADIAKVLGTTSAKGSRLAFGNCGVMPAQMNYEDSNGNIKILEYVMLPNNCTNAH